MGFWAHRGGVVAGYDSADPFTTTTNDFATVNDFNVVPLKTKQVFIEATGNNLGIQILGSYDGGSNFPTTVQGSVTVSTAAGSVFTVTDYYTHLRVQAVPATDNNHGTASVTVAGASH